MVRQNFGGRGFAPTMLCILQVFVAAGPDGMQSSDYMTFLFGRTLPIGAIVPI